MDYRNNNFKGQYKNYNANSMNLSTNLSTNQSDNQNTNIINTSNLNPIIKGIDLGYLYTKDSDLYIFKSAFTKIAPIMDDSNKIIINGETYFFGKGVTCGDTDKIDSEVNRICLLANLCHSGSAIYYLIVNLPIVQYKNRKDYCKQMIMDYNNCEVIFNNKKLHYKIQDVTVLPQGVASIYTLENQNQNMIIIDVGSYTINIVSVQFEDGDYKITNCDTIFMGLMHLYDLLIKTISQKYPTKFNMSEIQDLLINGFYYEGVKQDTTFVVPVIYDYLSSVFQKFKTTFPYKTSMIYVTGGGSNLLFPFFKATFAQCEELPNPQFSNALGCYNYGKYVFGGVFK